MTTGKTVALTSRTFVGKVMFLLLNMLSRLVITFLPNGKCLLISWLQSPSAVILEPKKLKFVTVSTASLLFTAIWFPLWLSWFHVLLLLLLLLLSHFSHVRLCVTPFSSVVQLCPTLCDPMNSSMPGLLSMTNSRSSPKPMSIESVMPSSHLILCHPLLFLPSIFPSIRVFSNKLAFHIRWPKY